MKISVLKFSVRTALAVLMMLGATAQARAETIYLDCVENNSSQHHMAVAIDLANKSVQRADDENRPATISTTAIDWAPPGSINGGTVTVHAHLDRTTGALSENATICPPRTECFQEHRSYACTKVSAPATKF